MTRQWRPSRRPGTGDTGASAVELVLLTPVIALMTFLPVQLGLWMHGRNLVTVAAQEGARAAAAADLTPQQGKERGTSAAEAFVVEQKVVQVQTISVTRGTDTAQATVTATGLSILPGLELRVTGSAQSAVEQFVGVP